MGKLLTLLACISFVVCDAGYEGTASDDSCALCEDRQFKALPGDGDCIDCGDGTTGASDTGSTSCGELMSI